MQRGSAAVKRGVRRHELQHLTGTGKCCQYVLLALAGSVAGGMTVGTTRTCYGEATAKVETSIVRHGPKGTAAEYSTHPSEEATLAVTLAVSGTCQAASGNISKGGREPGAISSPQLPKRLKTLDFSGG